MPSLVVSIGVNHTFKVIFYGLVKSRTKKLECFVRRYNRHILQWSKNDFKSRINTNGDYLTLNPLPTLNSHIISLIGHLNYFCSNSFYFPSLYELHSRNKGILKRKNDTQYQLVPLRTTCFT